MGVDTYGNSVAEVFNEEDPLEFDEEEFDQVLKVLQEAVHGVLRNGVVLPRTRGTGKPTGEQKMATNLSRSSYYRKQPRFSIFSDVLHS